MWPQRDGLGAQLGPGLPGPSLYLEQFDPERPWQFSRLREGGLDLQKVKNSTQRLVSPQPAQVEMSSDAIHQVNGVMLLFPEWASSELQNTGKRMDSRFIYNATEDAKLIDYGSIKKFNSSGYSKIFAYASGSSRSNLVVRGSVKQTCLVVVEQKRANKEDINGSDEEKDSDSDEDDKSSSDEGTEAGGKDGTRANIEKLRIPTFGTGSTLEFDSKIVQIEISKSCSAYDIPKNLIFVRTGASIFVIRVVISAKSAEVNLQSLIRLEFLDYFSNEFAHMNYDPYDNSRFAVIDRKGDWIVFQISSTKEFVNVLYRGAMNDPEDLSNFKRISWGKNENELILLSRSSVKTVDLKTSKTTDVISAKRWSSIRDYKMCDTKDDHAFLLTSREVIWVDLSNGFKRLLSWKHYLSEDDPSLTMYQTTINKTHYIICKNQLSPAIVTYQFRFQDGLPRSIQDPILIDSESTSWGETYLLLPVDKSFISLLKVSNQLEITSSLLSVERGEMIRLTRGSNQQDEEDIDSEAEFNNLKKTTGIGHLKEFALKSVHKAAFSVAKVQDQAVSDPEAFQKFVLSFKIDKTKASKPLNLQKASNEPLGEFKSFKEFDNMMEQLQQYFESNGFEFYSAKQFSKQLLKCSDGIVIESYQDVYNSLLKLWKSSIMARTATKSLSRSMSIINDASADSKRLNKRVKRLPKTLRKLVDDWDKDYSQADEEEDQFTQLVNERLQRTIDNDEPTIQITQSQTHPTASQQSSQRQLMRPSSRSNVSDPTSGFSQLSQRNESQLSSSQPGHKKKKKRIRGFA